MLTDPQLTPLFVAATAARNKAHAPYSGFKVGAAVQSLDGMIYSGCNIESSCFGLSVCAERVAVMKALSEGARKYSRLAVVTDTDSLHISCGACRQFLIELCGNIELYSVNLKKQMVCYMLADLIPLLPATVAESPLNKNASAK